MGGNPWLVGNLARDGNRLTVGGWALPPRGDFNAVTFTANDRPPSQVRVGLATAALNRVFFFVPNSTTSGFSLQVDLTDEELTRSHIKLSFVHTHTCEPLFHWHDIFVPVASQFVEPEPERIMRTSGTRDFWKYELTGYTVAMQLEKAIRTYFQTSIASYGDILDWGCGCARLTQPLRAIAPYSSVTGIDIDADNIAWCRDNIQNCRFIACDLLPPLELADNSVDLIVGISVITHQSDATQAKWCAELARVLRPGGVALISFNGEFVIAKVSEAQLLAALQTGIDDTQRDENLSGLIRDDAYYRTTVQTRRHFRQRFSERFHVVDVVPAGCASVQDLAILQKP